MRDKLVASTIWGKLRCTYIETLNPRREERQEEMADLEADPARHIMIR